MMMMMNNTESLIKMKKSFEHISHILCTMKNKIEHTHRDTIQINKTKE